MIASLFAIIEFVLDTFVEVAKKLFGLAVLAFLLVAFVITTIFIIVLQTMP